MHITVHAQFTPQSGYHNQISLITQITRPFTDLSLTFGFFPDFSLTLVEFSDISRFTKLPEKW